MPRGPCMIVFESGGEERGGDACGESLVYAILTDVAVSVREADGGPIGPMVGFRDGVLQGVTVADVDADVVLRSKGSVSPCCLTNRLRSAAYFAALLAHLHSHTQDNWLDSYNAQSDNGVATSPL